MIYLLAYDISKDKTRTKFAKNLEILGMIRIQKSLFAGKVNRKDLWSLVKIVSGKLDTDDLLYVFSLSAKQFKEKYAIGFQENEGLILGELHTLVL